MRVVLLAWFDFDTFHFILHYDSHSFCLSCRRETIIRFNIVIRIIYIYIYIYIDRYVYIYVYRYIHMQMKAKLGTSSSWQSQPRSPNTQMVA